MAERPSPEPTGSPTVTSADLPTRNQRADAIKRPAGHPSQKPAPGQMLEAVAVSHVFDVSRPFLQRVLDREPRRHLRAVDDVTFAIAPATTFALVGESGCGKSTIGRLCVGLFDPTDGDILFENQPLAKARVRPDLRRRMNMIFQDPYASLNPRWRVRDIVAEPLRTFRLAAQTRDVQDRVGALLAGVGLAARDGEKYPHQFSGGQRQRISVARALASEPDFLVCDEPTSALDVSVQAQILNLMRDLQQRLGLTYLLISHNLAVVRHMADRLGVMYLGRIVEQGPAEAIFQTPRHPYTRLLLDAIPNLGRIGAQDKSGRARRPVGGELPSPIAPPPGCTFHPRCPLANDRCRVEKPAHVQAGLVQVACHAVEEGRDV